MFFCKRDILKFLKINKYIFESKKCNSISKRRVILTSIPLVIFSQFINKSRAQQANNNILEADGIRRKPNKNNLNLTVKDFGAVGDGKSDDTNSIQAAADFTELNTGSYICFPNYDENYLIRSEIKVKEPGVKIFGFKGPTYNRGKKRKGNIILDEQAKCAFDMGNFRIWDKQDLNSNPADTWTIENIGVIQKLGTKPRSKNGFMFSSKTNGPDRGILLKECSASGLNASVYVPNPDDQISLSTFVIENCCFSNNNYSVFVEGRVCGARIVGNQMEQNILGAIHGALDGPVYIADNMLEGQPNTINITSHKNGNRLGVVIERNYFELNTGDYLIKIKLSSNTGVIIVQNNYDLNIKSKDFLVITGGGAANVTLGKNLFEPRCVTFDQCIGTIKYGSRILDDVNFYRIRRFLMGMGNRSALLLISDYENLLTNNNHKSIKLKAKDTYVSPFGPLKCISAAYPISLETSVQKFDVLGISIYCYIPQTDFCTIQLFNNLNEIYMDGSKVEIDTNGKWCLLNFAFFAQKDTQNLFLRFTNSKYIKIAAISVYNFGQHNNSGSDVKEIYPVMPNIFLT